MERSYRLNGALHFLGHVEELMALATSWNTTRFVVKHLVAAAVVTAGTGLLAAVSWLAAYLWASMSHSGSEPALPFLWAVMGGLGSGAASSVLVLLPSTTLAEVVGTRARLRVWWQLPLAALVILGIGMVTVIFNTTANHVALGSASALMLSATVRMLAALFVYWWSLQSIDWLLRTTVRVAGRLWPARFAAMARAQEEPSGLLMPRSRARFRIKEHFTFDDGATPVLVLSGSIIEGDVRSGMRACTTVDAREVWARIQSVESSGSIGDTPSLVGLLLPLSEAEMRVWQAATRHGSVVRIE
jgi:hypothetical protein